MKPSIAIIGEGLTEWFYFDQLRIAKHYSFKIAPDFPKHSDLDDIMALVKKKLCERYDIIICLIDMDIICADSCVKKKYDRYRKEYAKEKSVKFIESNPCTELWFLLHFLTCLSAKHYPRYEDLLPDLQKHIPNYEKKEKFFKQIKLYHYLEEKGNIENAISYAKQLCLLKDNTQKENCSFSEIFEVVELLNELNKRQL